MRLAISEVGFQMAEKEKAIDAANPRLEAIRLGLAGDWHGAHRLVQDLEDADAALVHAWLHRIEGDLGNARYWYRRAGKPVASGPFDDEGRAIAKALSS
jgi:hypothetical protein